MSLRTQLVLLFLFPIICALLATGGWIYAKRIAATTAVAGKQNIPLTNELTDFIAYLQAPPTPSSKSTQAYLLSVKNRISSLSVKLKPYFDSPEEHRLLHEITAIPDGLSQKLSKVTRGANQLSERGAEQLIHEIRAALVLPEQLSGLYQKMGQKTAERVNQLNLLLLATSTGWTLLYALLLFRTIARPISQIRDAVAAITRGDLNHRLTCGSGSELGRIATAFNKMVEVRQKAEQTARESDERAKELFENLQMPTVSIDLNGAITLCNTSLLQLVGKKQGEVLGRNWFDQFIPHPEQAKQRYSQTISKGEVSAHSQSDIMTRTGEHHTIAWANVLNRDSSGGIIGMTSVGIDITERLISEQVREQLLQRLQTLIDTNQEGQLLVDSSGTILVANSCFGRRFNRQSDQLAGTNLFALFDPQLARERQERFEQVIHTGQSLVFYDKRAFWEFENHLHPLKGPDGRVTAIAMLSIDVTARNQADQTLQATHEELTTAKQQLEQQLQQITADVTKLQTELTVVREQAAKSDHERLVDSSRIGQAIRIPMQVLLRQINLILHTELNDRQTSQLKLIHSVANALTETVHDLLDLSVLRSGQCQLQLREFSLVPLVERSVRLQRLRSKGKEIELRYQLSPDIPAFLVGDPLYLERLLTSLLAYTCSNRETGTVTLHLQPVATKTDTRQFGLQCTLEIMHTHTQPLSASERTDAETPLPVAIDDIKIEACRELASLMGGELSLGNSAEYSHTFSFIVTLQTGSPPQSQSIPAKPTFLEQHKQSLQGLQVLLAADKSMSAKLVQELLEISGATVTTAHSSRAAIQQIDTVSPLDLVVLDDQLSATDGYDTLKEIRRRHSKLQLPVIVLVTGHSKDKQDASLAAGANAQLAKPVIAENLYKLIARLTERTPHDEMHANDDSAITEQAVLPPQLPGIDKSKALLRVNGNQRLLAQLIRLFAQEHQRIPTEINQLIDDHDLASAARLLHGIKGASINLEAERLQLAATNLENALKSDNPVAAKALLPLLEGAVAEICSTAYLLDNPPPPEDGSPEALQALFGDLQYQIEQYDLEPPESFDTLHTLLMNSENRHQIDLLKAALQRLDQEEACFRLQQLAEICFAAGLTR